MKRTVSVLIFMLLILGCVAPTRAEDHGDMLKVVNCNEWVSLRKEPDEKSERLMKVPLGAVLFGMEGGTEDWTHVLYDGLEGYIDSGYLTLHVIDPDADDAAADFDELPALPPYDDFMEIGDLVCETVHDGYHVVVRHVIPFGAEREELLAVCYDPENRPLWTAFEVHDEITELNATTAFIAGTAESPCLVTFDSEKGFTARTIDSRGTLLWISNCANGGTALETVLPGGGLTTAVREDGTIYAIGYYNEAPVAIDVNGNFLWRGKNPDPLNVYWPYEIRPSASGITVLYDSCMEAENTVYAVTYDPLSGSCTDFTTIKAGT